jgi:putative peptidoglycan lipid II flippase
MAFGLAVFQLNTLLDHLLAYFLSSDEPAATIAVAGWKVALPCEAGAVAALQWAQRLQQLPIGLFAVAVATAVFPALARAARGGAGDAFRRTLGEGLVLAWFVALPATAGLVLVRGPLVSAVFEHGRFGTEQTQRVAAILMGYACAVLPYALAHVATRAHYARGETRRPVRVAAAMVAVNLAANLVLIWPLGAVGLAWGSALSATGQCVWLLGGEWRFGIDPRGWGLGRAARTVGGTAVMTAVVMGVRALLPAQAPAAASLAIMVAAGVGSYAVTAWASGAEELRWLVRS